MYKEDLGSNNLKYLIFHKMKPNKIIYIWYICIKRIWHLITYNGWYAVKPNLRYGLVLRHINYCRLLYQPCNILICMQKHSQHNNDERTQFFRKIYISHFIRNSMKGLREGYVWGVSFRLNKAATYWPPALLVIATLLSHPAGLLNLKGPALCWVWFSLLHTATTDSKLWSPTNWLPVAPGYIVAWHPPASVSVASAPNSTRQQSRVSPDIFDQMHLLFTHVHFLFDSSAGSEVNILQSFIFNI